MFDVSRLFGKGIRNTLFLKNGLQLSYNGPYVVVGTDTVMDQFHVNTFCTAEYTMSVDYDTNNKEIIKVLVSATPSNSSVTVYGRSNMGNDLVNITSTVNNSYVRIVLNPAQKTPTTTYAGAKVIFSATYFQTQNALQGGAAELINSGNNYDNTNVNSGQGGGSGY